MLREARPEDGAKHLSHHFEIVFSQSAELASDELSARPLREAASTSGA
jgi:hypothetical protein